MCDFIIGKQLDIVAVTETWLNGNSKDDPVKVDFENTLPNYQFFMLIDEPAELKGRCVRARDGLHVRLYDSGAFPSFEHMHLNIVSGFTSLQLEVIYRLPPRPNTSPTSFFYDVSTLLEFLSVNVVPVLITGDLNIHVDKIDNREASKFLDILTLHNLESHVRVPTHNGGHTLDQVITRKESNLLSTQIIDSSLPSDHLAIRCNVDICRPGHSAKQVKSRHTRGINVNDFRTDIRSSLESLSFIPDLDTMVNQYKMERDMRWNGLCFYALTRLGITIH